MSVVLLGLLALGLLDDSKAGPTPDAQAARKKAHRALLVEYFNDRATGKSLRWEYFAPRFLKEAEETPGDSVGYDALFWLSTQGDVDHPEFSKAIALLTRHHAKSEEIKDLCRWVVSPRYFATASERVEGLLREVIATNPNRDVRAEASFSLSQYLRNKAEFVRLLTRPEGGDLARRMGHRWGQGYVHNLKQCKYSKVTDEASQLFNWGRVIYPRYWASHPTFGKSTPDIKGGDIEGKGMALSDHRGKVVVLGFWGTWCLPCRAMFPQERSLVERLKDKPFVLLGIANDTDRAKVKKMVEDEGITWRSWWDGEGTGSPITTSWQVSAWPGIYVLDHRGVIRYRDIRGDDLDFAVEALLTAMAAEVHDR